MNYAIIILFSYLLGTSSMALYLSLWKGVDFRKKGSGNLGASNAAVLLGWRAGVLVAVHDALKAMIAVWLAQHFFPEVPNAGVLAGLCAVLGHIFPFYLKFRGGKGFASYIGMILALNWKFALAVLALAVVVTVVTDYIVLATLSTTVVVPTFLLYQNPSVLLAVMLLTVTAVIYWKHRTNIQRMLNHTEIGLRSTVKGENRVK